MKALIIAPHPDDELCIAGSTIINLRNKGIDVIVLFTTNGDYRNFYKDKRICEAIHSLAYLGIDKSKVIFLGYGNEWEGSHHIYNASGNEVLRSTAGYRQTYSALHHPEYCFLHEGIHHEYTRNNYKQDLKDVIQKCRPEIIFCVDFEIHPDHRATSLLFDEVVGEILKRRDEYYPFIFKKFTYAGVWWGDQDYYFSPKRPTLPPEVKFCGCFDLDVPSYTWESRIRFTAAESTLTKFLRDNLLFVAAKQYKSQLAHARIVRVCNSDDVYWYRRTDNHAMSAVFEVSSGEKEYLNDFKLIDCPDVNIRDADLTLFANCIWIPSQSDRDKSIKMSFPNPVDIGSIILYENFSPVDNILDAIVSFDNGYQIHTGELNHLGGETIISFDIQKQVLSLYLKILNYEGANPGLCEIEIYSSRNPNDRLLEIPLERYKQPEGIDEYDRTQPEKIMFKIAVMYFTLLERLTDFKFKILMVKNRIMKLHD